MAIVKNKKPAKVLTSEQLTKITKDKLLLKTSIEQRLANTETQYVAAVQKNQGKKRKNVKKVFAMSRKMERLQVRLQRINIELLRLEEGTYVHLTPIAKTMKYFRQMPYEKQKVVFGIMFLLPWVIGFTIFFLTPMITTVWWSLNEMTVIAGGGFSYKYVGLGNFISLFTSETLAGTTVSEVLTRSILDILIDLPTILIFSLFIAVLLNTRFKGHEIVKAIFFIPVIFNMTVINNTLTGTFGQFFDSSLEEGFVLSQQFSSFLMQIGIGTGLVEFLTSAVDRIFTIVNMSGIQILIFIAALQSIPLHLYEAAKVEGATQYEMFWKITMPMVSPMILTTAVFTIVDSFATSDIMRFLTVNSQGTTMATNQPGLYSSISIVYFLANALIILIVFGLMRKAVFYYD